MIDPSAPAAAGRSGAIAVGLRGIIPLVVFFCVAAWVPFPVATTLDPGEKYTIYRMRSDGGGMFLNLRREATSGLRARFAYVSEAPPVPVGAGGATTGGARFPVGTVSHKRARLLGDAVVWSSQYTDAATIVGWPVGGWQYLSGLDVNALVPALALPALSLLTLLIPPVRSAAAWWLYRLRLGRLLRSHRRGFPVKTAVERDEGLKPRGVGTEDQKTDGDGKRFTASN